MAVTLPPVTLHAFSGLDGAHVCRLPWSSLRWSDSIGKDGSLSATVSIGKWDEGLVVRAYGTILAAVRDGRVLHAGYLTSAKLDRGAGTWSLNAGGGGTVLSKRLAMRHDLDAHWSDGNVAVDTDSPSGYWPLTVSGSYSDLISLLIRETEEWGPLPIVPAALTGGNKTRTYNSYDYATVSQRISDILRLENGPESRFDPLLSPDWHLSFAQVTSADGGELVDHRWKWNPIVPGSGVSVGAEDVDGGDMCSQVYAHGKSDNKVLLVARASSSALTSAGWPLLQEADTSHSTVERLDTLLAYARAGAAVGDDPQRTVDLTVSADRDVRVGDWADVRVGEADMDVLALKVCDVRGDGGSGFLTVSCRVRGH